MIAVVDFGAGNLHSVVKAMRYIGEAVQVTHDPDVITMADGLVLPGVGAFGPCMEALSIRGLADPIRVFIESGRPFLGICIGMQMLFTDSDEGSSARGLRILNGTVRRFKTARGSDGMAMKVPHMGWNTIDIKKADPLFAGLPEAPMVYFVHSFHVIPEDPTIVAATTEYGSPFCSAVVHDNVRATQFHPEKSGAIGLEMLRNFSTLAA
ncbi:MAG: imidazole glycerol phosphate synthase subunit HisH [Chthonomonadales bacterium]|nr:imidazole glycerol phosphate synthase subunit HisH [Chthonomonadales bacterium]